MRSKAAIGNHPIHPMIVPLPIGAFFLALVGDILHLSGRDPFWYRFASFCIVVGIVTALLAAVFGAIEYFGVEMSPAGRRVATWHAILNVTVVVLYAVSWWMRRNDAALGNDRFSLAMGLAVVAFLMLGVSGWLGGNLSYHHKIGVVEKLDQKATEIGMRESAG
ncbi:MAG TPA: DUF2231 domain-containing protein [Thermoanaerobaculia bacterium]|nr:DUF2231 domain-containing protein [Thermoanaerobaculia bacterium]